MSTDQPQDQRLIESKLAEQRKSHLSDMKRYGAHRAGCPAGGEWPGSLKCNCGFTAALAALEK